MEVFFYVALFYKMKTICPKRKITKMTEKTESCVDFSLVY